MRSCWRCGITVEEGVPYCHNCGAAIGAHNYSNGTSSTIGFSQGKDRKALVIIAVLVAVFIVIPGIAFLFFINSVNEEMERMNPTHTPSVSTSIYRIDPTTVRCEFTSCDPSFEVSMSCMFDMEVNGMQSTDPWQEFIGNSVQFLIDDISYTVTFQDGDGDGYADGGESLDIASDVQTGMVNYSLCLLFLPTGESIFNAYASV